MTQVLPKVIPRHCDGLESEARAPSIVIVIVVTFEPVTDGGPPPVIVITIAIVALPTALALGPVLRVVPSKVPRVVIAGGDGDTNTGDQPEREQRLRRFVTVITTPSYPTELIWISVNSSRPAGVSLRHPAPACIDRAIFVAVDIELFGCAGDFDRPTYR